jgi:uncharacterized membrane protein
MSSIPIFRQIRIKQIVTENSRNATRKQLNDELVVLDNEQAEFEENKNKTITEFSLKGADVSQINKIRQKFDQEAAKFHVMRDELQMKLMSLDELKIGEEILGGYIEGPYVLEVGAQLDDATKAEVIIKDGQVVDIRQ